MGRTHHNAVLAAAMFGATACAEQTDPGAMLQAAGILAVVERTSPGAHPAEPEALCVMTLSAGEGPMDGGVRADEPPPALLEALAAAGWPAVPESTCGPDDWYMEGGEPFTVTADGTPALKVWVYPPDPEQPGRVRAGSVPWPLQDQEWECRAAEVDGAWIVDSCESIPDP